MTSTISEDALQGQQSRIMKALRDSMQPSQGVSLDQLGQAINVGNTGGDYFDTLNKSSANNKQANINAETGIFNQMKEQVARGDADAAAVDKAITSVAGDDPKLYAGIAQDLHNDPTKIDANNARQKVMLYAAQRGINPLHLR